MSTFLTSLDILDTGFLSKTTRTNQLSTSLRVNSGAALRLKGVMVEIGSSSNLDISAFAGNTTTAPEIPLLSINPRTIKVTIFLNSDNVSTSNIWGINDMALITELIRLPETAGWKALYYPVDDSVTSRKKTSQMIYYLGSKDTVENQGDINITLATSDTASASSKNLTNVRYIAVRFDNHTIKQDGDSKSVKVELTGYVTG